MANAQLSRGGLRSRTEEGVLAKIHRAWQVALLVAVYDARRLVCLRHTQEPVRDFVLAHAASIEVHALSSVAAAGVHSEVPHDIARHGWILEGLGIAPAALEDLLPRFESGGGPRSMRAVLAPYSSAR